MVIDRVLFRLRRFLFAQRFVSTHRHRPFPTFVYVLLFHHRISPRFLECRSRLTGASIQALKLCSSCAHPAAALPPADAQHPSRSQLQTPAAIHCGVMGVYRGQKS